MNVKFRLGIQIHVSRSSFAGLEETTIVLPAKGEIWLVEGEVGEIEGGSGEIWLVE